MRKLNSIDSDSFVDAIRRSIIVDNIVHLVDYTVADLCRLYHSKLRKLLDEIAPPIFTLNRHKSLWFDGECSAIRRQARALERRYRPSRLPADLVAWSASLEEKRTLFTLNEKTYWSRKLEGCSDNSKQLWHCLNSILMRDVTPSTGDASLPLSHYLTFSKKKCARFVLPLSPVRLPSFQDPTSLALINFNPARLKKFVASYSSRRQNRVHLTRCLTHCSLNRWITSCLF